MKKLNFGTAGIPSSTPPKVKTSSGINHVKTLGLDAMELEFVRGVNITEERAPEVRKAAEDSNVILTCHAPYYINLNSDDREKLQASIQRITNSAEIVNLCGGYSVCFHAGFYQQKTKQETYNRIKRAIEEIVKYLKAKDNKVWIRPEVSGKFSQFGQLDETLKLSEEIEQVLPCIDFAHHHAKGGKNNTYEEFHKILEQMEKQLGKEALERMHIHVSGIEYGEKGEKRHLNLEDSDLNYKDLIKAWKDFNIKGVVISESPNIEQDALLMQGTFKSL